FQALIRRTFTVTTTADSGSGSLQDALSQANAVAPTADTITFAVTGTISLLAPLPAISDSITIIGPGSSMLTIAPAADAPGLFSIFDVYGRDGLGIQISGLTVSGGSASGIVLSGNDVDTLTDVSVVGSSSENRGGGINISGGSLTMTGCTVAN